MSNIINIILVTAVTDGSPSADDVFPSVDQLNTFFREKKYDENDYLRPVHDCADGSRAMECDVFMAGINYLDIDEFLEALRTVSWGQPECVQLFLKGQDHNRFDIYTLEWSGGKGYKVTRTICDQY